MVNDPPLFCYKYGTTILHKIDARLKLLLILAAGYAAFFLQDIPCAVCIAAAFPLACYAGFSLREQLAQLKPAVYYAAMLYTASIISAACSRTPFPEAFRPQKSDGTLILRLVLSLQITGILYRTTSPLALRTALIQIEDGFTGIFSKKKHESGSLRFSEAFSLLLIFIPQVFSVWRQAVRAWQARNGKKNIRMMILLFPVLISVCMKRSYIMSLAIQNRRPEPL